MKVLISLPKEEFEGEIFEKKVTKFGTSAHIPFSKKYLWTKVKILVPFEKCLLTDSEISDLCRSCKVVLDKKSKKKEYLDSVNNIESKCFTKKDLNNVLFALVGTGKEEDLCRKIKEIYKI